jgi:molecular chaperone DnaJ
LQSIMAETIRREWLETDYYAVLGVDKDASAGEIKKAYRKLARENHPDATAADAAAEERFKKVGEAYAVLGDKETRKQYDETRRLGPFVGGPGRTHQQQVSVEDLFGGGSRGGSPFDLFGGLGDLFSQNAARPQPGPDLTAELTLSFDEALAGTSRQLTINGRAVTAKIPKGVANGARVRLKGQGGRGANGGPDGDLYIKVKVGRHPHFRRAGKDLKITVPVTFAEAALGADISVPTLDAPVTLRVPAGTASGKTFKLTGRGVETAKGTGNLLVTVEVVVPSDLTAEQRRLIEELDSTEPTKNPRSHLGVET